MTERPSRRQDQTHSKVWSPKAAENQTAELPRVALEQTPKQVFRVGGKTSAMVSPVLQEQQFCPACI